MLQRKGGFRQQYHGKALIGNHCDRVLEHREHIVNAMEEGFMINELRKPDLPESINDEIHMFFVMIGENFSPSVRELHRV